MEWASSALQVSDYMIKVCFLGILGSPSLVTVWIALSDGKFGAYMQVHIQNDGPVTIELESSAPGATTSDPKQVSVELGCL